jgi:hypothetical protein
LDEIRDNGGRRRGRLLGFFGFRFVLLRVLGVDVPFDGGLQRRDGLGNRFVVE